MIVYRELASIERELGFSARTLYAITNDIGKHYRKVRLPKRDGGCRELSVPDRLLATVQRAIAERLLAYEPVSRFAKAYKPAASTLKNATPHVGKKMVLKLDIRHFFDRILYVTVKERAFPAEKYSEPIRVLLTMLCYCGDVLPQGAPSSPAITNILMREFDETVGEWCRARSIAYTRYCDDMTFSGDLDGGEVIAFVSAALREMGLYLNGRKTAHLSRSKRQTVTGIVVNEKPNIPREYKREVRAAVYYCRQYGVQEHIDRKGLDMPVDRFLHSLLGKINYILQICPDDANAIAYKKIVLEWMKQ